MYVRLLSLGLLDMTLAMIMYANDRKIVVQRASQSGW